MGRREKYIKIKDEKGSELVESKDLSKLEDQLDDLLVLKIFNGQCFEDGLGEKYKAEVDRLDKLIKEKKKEIGERNQYNLELTREIDILDYMISHAN